LCNIDENTYSKLYQCVTWLNEASIHLQVNICYYTEVEKKYIA